MEIIRKILRVCFFLVLIMGLYGVVIGHLHHVVSVGVAAVMVVMLKKDVYVNKC